MLPSSDLLLVCNLSAQFLTYCGYTEERKKSEAMPDDNNK